MKKPVSIFLLICLVFGNTSVFAKASETTVIPAETTPVSSESSASSSDGTVVPSVPTESVTPAETPATSSVTEPATTEQSSPASESSTPASPDGSTSSTPVEKSSAQTSSMNSDSNSPYSYFSDGYFYNQTNRSLKNPGKSTVSEFSGDLGYSYNIEVPEGRTGLTPSVAFSYSSQNSGEESILGYGWNYADAKIFRDTKKGIDGMYKDENNFIVDLFGNSQEYVFTETSGTHKLYRLRYGADDMKLVKDGNFFYLYDSTGNVFTFSITQSNGSDRTFAWFLSSILDLNGNKIEYTYTTDSNQMYPEKIRYDFVSGSPKTEIVFILKNRDISVFDGSRGFLTETKKEIDRIEIWSNGKKRKMTQVSYIKGTNGKREMVSSIQETGFDDAGNSKSLPKTEFEYRTQENSGWEKVDGNINYEEPNVFFCKYSSQGYPSSYYDRYTSQDLGIVNIDENMDGMNEPLKKGLVGVGSNYTDTCNSVSDNGIRLGDLNGDTKADKLEGTISKSVSGWAPPSSYTCTSSAYINEDGNLVYNTTYKPPVCIRKNYVSRYNREYTFDRGVQVVDINGDGLEDIVQAFSGNHIASYDCDPEECNGGTVNVYINTGKGWEKSQVWESGFPPGVRFASYNEIQQTGRTSYKIQSNLAMFEEINGDSLPDIIDSSGKVFINTGKGWIQKSEWTLPSDMPFFVNAPYQQGVVPVEAEGGVRFTDLNGDGLIDIIRKINHRELRNTTDPISPDEDVYSYIIRTESKAYLNTGNGWVSVSGWELPEEITNNVYKKGNWSYGYGLDGVLRFSGISETSYNKGTRFLDMNNDGVEDFLVSYVVSDGNPYKKRLYKNKGNKSDILKKIKTTEGGEIEINYQLSTQYKNTDGTLKTKMPQNIWTVKDVSEKDGIGNIMKTSYEYSDGFYSYISQKEKGMNGFGKVEIKDAEGNSVIHYFHQAGGRNGSNEGEYDDHKSKIGKMYREEIFDATGKKMKQVINKWEKVQKPNPAIFDGNERYFVYLSQTLGTSIDGNVAVSNAKEITYDQTTGNITQEKNLGDVTAAQSFSQTTPMFTDIGNDIVITSYTYALNQTKNILSFPKEIVIKDSSGTELQKTRKYYDGLSLGSIDKGNLTREESFLKEENRFIGVSYEYDSFGNVLKKTDSKGNVSVISYDTVFFKFPISLKSPLGHEIKAEYDVFSGNITKITDVNGFEKSFSYDPVGRVLQIKSPKVNSGIKTATELIEKYNYDDVSFPRKIEKFVKNEWDTSDGFFQQTSYFDGLGRDIESISETETGTKTIGKIYNKRGLVDKEILSYKTIDFVYKPLTKSSIGTEYTYDVLGRTVSIKNSLGTTTISFSGRTTETLDPEGRKTVSISDAYGRIIESQKFLKNGTNVSTISTKYNYDLLGRLVFITDALGNKRDFSYDSLNRKIQETDWYRPNATSKLLFKYFYDDNGNVLKTIDPKNQNIENTYDSLSRVLSQKSPTNQTTYTYDTAENGKGKVATVLAQNLVPVLTSTITKNYTYNELGSVKEEKKTIDLKDYTTKTITDELGRIKEITLPDSSKTTYSYHKGSDIDIVKNMGPAGVESVVVKNIDYSVLNQMEKIEFGDGTVSINTYDPNQMYRLIEKKTLGKDTLPIQSFGYSYDKIGNILTIADAIKGETIQYEYDSLNRLTKSIVSASNNLIPPYTETYQYDIIGNITYKSDVGTYEYNDTHPQRVTKAGTKLYTYDLNGNRVSDGETTYEWDAVNRLTKTTKGTQILNYTYDEGFSRILKTNPLKNEKVVYINSSYEIETNPDGEIARKFVSAGNQKVATIEKTTKTGISLKDNLMLEWRMNEGAGTSAADTSGGNQTGTLKNGVGWNTGIETAGSQNFATKLDGVDDYVFLGDTDRTKKVGKNLSFGLWMKTDRTGIYQWLLQKGSSNALINQGYFVELLNDNRIYVRLQNKTGQTANFWGNTILPINTWHFVMVTYDGVTVRLYVNGKEDTNKAFTGEINETAHGLFAGVFNRGTTTATPSLSYYFRGLLDNVMVYNRTLTADEIAKLFTLKGGEIPGSSIGTGGTYFHHPDHLGSASVTTDTNGSVVSDTRYYPYGKTRWESATVKDDYKYTGKERDEETDLYYYGFRYYDANIGAFISLDPLQHDVASMVKMGELNGYAYVQNNPMIYTDPTGMSNEGDTLSCPNCSGGGEQIAPPTFDIPSGSSASSSTGDFVDYMFGFMNGFADSMMYDVIPDGNNENKSMARLEGEKAGADTAFGVSVVETGVGGASMGATGPTLATCPATGGGGCVVAGVEAGAGVTLTVHGATSGTIAALKGRVMQAKIDKRLKEGQQKVGRQQGPREIDRIDKPKPDQPGDQWHAHDTSKKNAVNQDGTARHGTLNWVTNKVRNFLNDHGFNIPKN